MHLSALSRATRPEHRNPIVALHREHAEHDRLTEPWEGSEAWRERERHYGLSDAECALACAPLSCAVTRIPRTIPEQRNAA